MGKNKGKKKQQQQQAEQPAAPPQGPQPGPSGESSQPPGDQPKKGKEGKKKQQQQAEQPAPPPQEPQPDSSRESSQPPGDQPKKGKEGKKKQQKQAEQPAPPPQEPQPDSSRESSQPPGDQPKKGKEGKKKQQQQAEQLAAPPQGPQSSSSRESSQPPDQPKKTKKGEQPGPPSQGTQPVPQEPSGPQGDQPKKGKKKGQRQEQQSQQQPDDGRGSRQDQPPKGAKAPQQGQSRPEGTTAPQQPQRQQGPPVQQQAPAWRQQQQPQQISGPQAAQSQQQRGPPWGAQQAGVPPPQQGWRQPEPAQHPGVQPGPMFQGPPGMQPHPMFQGPPPQGFPPGQQPPQIQQQQRGPPPQRGAQWGQPQQQQLPPTPGVQPGPIYQAPPPQGFPPGQQPPQIQQQERGPPPQRGARRGQPQQQQPPPTPASPPGYQQVPQQQGTPGQQQTRGPPPQRGAGRGQPGQQQPPPGQQPSRSSVPSVGSVTSSLAGLEVTKREQRDRGDAGIVSTTRIKPGTKGRVIKVESNHLQLNLGTLKVAYHYDVAIDPDRPKKFMRPVVDSFIRKLFPNRWPAFDGMKNLYSSSPLTNNLNDYFEDEVTITEDDNREKKFKVEMKYANKVDLTPLHNLFDSPATPQEALQVVDIVLRMAPVVSCFPVGRSFFVKPERIIDLGQGMEMYHGFYQSAIRGWKPLLNVDVAHKAFPKDVNVVDALIDLLNTGRQEFRREDLRSLDRFQEETLSSFIRTLRINYEIPGHRESRKGYRVNGLGESAQTAKFQHENRELTVVEYFNRYKNYRIKYPMLPTLWVGNQQRPDKILLPLELCWICEGQALNRKMTDLQTSKMIRYAATDTRTRKNKIVQGIDRANYNQNPCVREFGFSVGNEFQKLDARVLRPPDLLYGNNRNVTVSKGVWRNDSFLVGVTINRWTIVNASRYPPRPDDYKKMTDLFERSARDCGMNFTNRATEPFRNISGRQAYSDIEQYFKSEKGKFDVIFVIVPDSGPQYSYVKRAAEIVVGCLTQCIKSSTVGRKMNPQTAVNILLKVNSKLNGINHTFSPQTKPNILKRPVMIMGADVTHPAPGADNRNIPSVAAVTASHDPKAFKYNICWRLQNPTVEIISDLEAIVLEHLTFFNKTTKCKPEAIVFFRDGVSEGQFEQVKNAEIRAIRAACKRVQADGYEPKITFLVVQKRHHTRLFPLNPKDSEDRNCNVPAGTCVDRDITHPFLQDFYLVSHASIQGVAKPTKYCTLWDDNNMDNDTVEELAYYLCHMFSRCNRSVSYPAPTYYAHLAAARAKVYIENDRLNMDRLQQEFNRFQIRDEIRKDLPMFFV